MILIGLRGNLGYPACFPKEEYWLTIEERGGRDDMPEVGLVHSRGVAGVMPCESTSSLEGTNANTQW